MGARLHTNVEVEHHAYTTINGQDAGIVLDEICSFCHEGIEECSIIRQSIEENDGEVPNTKETWENTSEYLESILCHILNLLGD